MTHGGGKLLVDGLCQGLQISVQGHKFEADCFAIPLSEFDVVIGIRWLNALGHVVWDGPNHTIEFRQKYAMVKWHGEATIRENEGPALNMIGHGSGILEDWFAEEEEIFTTPMATGASRLIGGMQIISVVGT